MKKLMMIAAAVVLTACGGGGGGTDAPAKPSETCKTVTDTTGDLIAKDGTVLKAGVTTTYSLCCAKGFKVFTTGDKLNADGTTNKGVVSNSCTI